VELKCQQTAAAYHGILEFCTLKAGDKNETS